MQVDTPLPQLINQLNANFAKLDKEAINALNVVKSGVTSIGSDGSTENWTTTEHGLNFVPIVFAFLNGVNLGSITTNANMPLPTWAAVGIDSSDNELDFRVWIQAFADAENLYIYMLNSTGSPVGGLDIKYYLMQEPAN